jgi:hypothetical protein
LPLTIKVKAPLTAAAAAVPVVNPVRSLLAKVAAFHSLSNAF